MTQEIWFYLLIPKVILAEAKWILTVVRQDFFLGFCPDFLKWKLSSTVSMEQHFTLYAIVLALNLGQIIALWHIILMEVWCLAVVD
jgi:hypothetical protein